MSDMANNAQELLQQQLCNVLMQERENILLAANAFYDAQGRTEQQCIDLTAAVIAAIDQVLAAGDWESSSFLKNSAKPLRQLRAEALQTQQELLQGQGLVEIETYALQPDEVKVYVSLYQTDGHDLQKWESQLRSISAYVSGRPIYRNEADVKKVIRQKVLHASEAYAVVVLNKNKLMTQDMFSKKTDRLGLELVTVEVGAVTENDVIEFVHLSKAYHFHNQRLILQENKR